MKINSITRGRWILLCMAYLIISPFCTYALDYSCVLHTPISDHLNVQQSKISGIITDNLGNPLVGIHVMVQAQKQGVVTNFDGTYTVTANPKDTLVVSGLGFKTQTIAINNRQVINIQLQEDITQLDTVTLNAGYYTVKDKERTGNISRISSKDIEKQPVSNPLAALQGRVSGVEITQTSGVPGAGFNIKIRGQNSIRANGNDPLYVIDGVPYASETLGDRQTSGSIIPLSGVSPLNNINPTDIESIEILKDADATAIYGSRGANGVVLITTKKGKVGTSSFKLNVSTGFGNVARRLDVLSTQDYINMREEAYANDGIATLPFNAYDINGTWDTNRNTDWQKELFGKTAYLTNVQGTFSGGSEQTQFLLSGNYNKQTTVLPGDSDNDKITVHSNLNHQSKDKKLAIQFSAYYTSNINNLPASDLVREALTLAPNAPDLYNDDGSLNWENSTWNNPLRNLEGKYLAQSTTLISNATINYTLNKGLKLVTSLGYTESDLQELRTVPSTTLNPAYGLGSDISSAIHNNADRTSWIIEPQLHGTFHLGKTKIESLVGFTFQEQKSHRLSQFAFGFTNNNFIENIAAASSLFVLGDTQTQYRYHALFSRINLNHQGKYILNLTGRRDGSSRFGDDKKFADFGAVGAAWIFSNESFIESALPFLSFGKIRASYGTSGNDQIGDYQYLDTYNFGSSPYQNIIGLQPTRLYNPNFSWESNKKLEFSMELGFLQDRIFISSSYYRNKSSNQLVGIPLPGTTGFNFLNANLNATVENKGWEFELNTTNIASKNIRWTTSINLTLPKNKLLEFPDLEGSTYANQLVIGQPLNIIKVYQYTGVNPQTGLYEFTDFNEDSTISAPDDKQVIKDLNPKYFGGINNHFSYKKFSLDVLFQFTKQLGVHFLGIPGTMGSQTNDVLQRWQNVGDQTSVQRYTSGLNFEGLVAYSNYTQSDAVIGDSSYLRLKTLALSYQISKKTSKGIGCDLFLRAHNLLTITSYNGLDPETRSSSTIPPLRFISLGTQLTF
ncbi:SusC/RagA family TonB-linked outer membrane protein [Changchengzhania lutea]|uniref:SusC/RagA family TonB-linked outer membrane protein n=1 Tax=Changchengzhania lutea TaxID=2049305 RepID=UPI00115D549C|nr:SusC/RagA family TonB-linked outer membrane protein [Changchengzhania lutea]